MNFLRVGKTTVNLEDVSYFQREGSVVIAVMSSGERVRFEGANAEAIALVLDRFATPADIVALADSDNEGILYAPGTPPWRRLKTALEGLVKS